MNQPSIDDSEGLRRAYEREDGLYDFGGALYIAGTKDPIDVAEWYKLPAGKVNRTKRYKDALFHLKMMDKPPQRLVGHSLGASVAQSLGEDWGTEVRAYGTPAFDPMGRGEKEHTLRFRHWGDPVGSLDSGAGIVKAPGWNPHSFQGYHFRSNETLS